MRANRVSAIFTQVVHFYSDGVGHITVGGNHFDESVRKLPLTPRATRV